VLVRPVSSATQGQGSWADSVWVPHLGSCLGSLCPCAGRLGLALSCLCPCLGSLRPCLGCFGPCAGGLCACLCGLNLVLGALCAVLVGHQPGLQHLTRHRQGSAGVDRAACGGESPPPTDLRLVLLPLEHLLEPVPRVIQLHLSKGRPNTGRVSALAHKTQP
jgi:hypothetical protein